MCMLNMNKPLITLEGADKGVECDESPWLELGVG